MSLKYYVYISDSKVEMLYAQIPRAFLSGLSGELKVNLGVLSTTLKQDADAETKFAKLSAVLKYLEQHQSIGSVDEPLAYFRGTMSMTSGEHRQRSKEGVDLSFVYFGGMTSRTVLGLGGSRKHLIGAAPAPGSPSESSLSFKTVQNVRELINSRVLLDEKGAEVVEANEGDAGLGSVIYAATYPMKGFSQPFEFVARRLWYGDIWPGKPPKALLGTPLYVAAAD